MNTKKLTVCKANQLIEATYRLTLNETRVINACIAQVDSVAPLLATDKFELSAKDFAKLFGISEDRAYSELQATTKTLYERSLTIYNPDPKQPKIKKMETRWISTIGYMPEDGKIYLYFSQGILPFLSELKGQFTKYELTQISGMTCIYAYRLYELLTKEEWKKTGEREIEIAWLKSHLELDSGYDRMNNFKARVIDPAVKDINEYSNYQVTYTQRKTGRSVTHLIFKFRVKKSPEAIAEAEAAKEKARQEKNTLRGVPKSEIIDEAGSGEDWGVVAERINRNKESKNTTTATVMPNLTIPQTPKNVMSDEDYRKKSIPVLQFLCETPAKKAALLKEFNEKGHINHSMIKQGKLDILRPELEAAGLFN